MDMNLLMLHDNWRHCYELGNGSMVKKISKVAVMRLREDQKL